MTIVHGTADGVCHHGRPSIAATARTARKEYWWSKLSDEHRKLWAEAARKGWNAYTDNSAVEVLDAKQSRQ